VTLPNPELRLGAEYSDEKQVNSNERWDIWEALWLGGQKVRLSVRQGSYQVISKTDQQLLRRELSIRRQLHSPYILPLYGVCCEPERPPFRVSPLCGNGTAVEYLREKSMSDIFKTCLEVAYGLRFLHSFDTPIVLGGVKGESVYISDEGTALLTGFELSGHEGGTFDSSMVGRGQWSQWIAPELVTSTMENTEFQLIKACDIWTWAMAALELMSKQPPYSVLDLDALVRGQRLDLDGFELPSESELRPLLQSCWQTKPDMRPGINEVIVRMEGILATYKDRSLEPNLRYEKGVVALR